MTILASSGFTDQLSMCSLSLAKGHSQCNFKPKKHLSVSDILLMNFILKKTQTKHYSKLLAYNG